MIYCYVQEKNRLYHRMIDTSAYLIDLKFKILIIVV